MLPCDSRALPIPSEGSYDKIVSIEMLKAVGRECLATYFEYFDKFLKADGGVAVFECITMPETRYEGYTKGDGFIRKYIFPGGYLPIVSKLVASIAKGSKDSLIVESVENIGGHYARTLRLWNEKFVQSFDFRIRAAWSAEHKGMTENNAALSQAEVGGKQCFSWRKIVLLTIVPVLFHLLRSWLQYQNAEVMSSSR